MSEGFFTNDPTPEELQQQRALSLAQLLQQQGLEPGRGAYGGLASVGKALAGAILAKRANTNLTNLGTDRTANYARALGNALGPSDNSAWDAGPPTDASGDPGQLQISPRVGASPAQRLAATMNPDLMKQAGPQMLAQQMQATAPITPFQQQGIERQKMLDNRPTFHQPGEIPTDPNTGAPAVGPDGQPLSPTGGQIHYLTPDEINAAGLPVGTSAFNRGDGLPPTILNKPPVPEPPKSPERRAQDLADTATDARARAQATLDVANTPPKTTQDERDSLAAQAASGQPLTQIVPGYRGDVTAKRQQARSDAIALIQKQNPGMSASDAGIELANRTIAFQSGKRSQGQLTVMLGATRQALGQLDFNIGKAKEEMAKLPSTDLSPILNAIARGEEKWTGNPAYSSLFYYMHATAVESARLLSGGQASTAQLHQGAMEEAQKWAGINMTPASFNAVADAMHAEGGNRMQTYQDALSQARVGGNAPGPGQAPPPAAAPGGAPKGITIDKNGNIVK